MYDADVIQAFGLYTADQNKMSKGERPRKGYWNIGE